MSKSKTCGECKYRYAYHHDEDCNGRCKLSVLYRIPSNKPACSKFKPIPPMTNGDLIQQMSSGVLAFFLTRLLVDGCPIGKNKPFNDCKISNDCTNCLKSWINSPVKEESEVNSEQ